MTDSAQPDAGDEVDRILSEYFAERERGEASSPEQVIAAHPEHADALREFFSSEVELYRLLNRQEKPQVKGRGARVRYFGDYELLTQLGAGGMGVVYLARQTSLGRLVALKMIRPEYVHSNDAAARFQLEAKQAAQLHHPNIVRIHEIGQVEGRHYFSMDYIAGPNLAQTLESGPIEARRAAEIIQNVAEAVHYAHTCGVIHRDIKPQNILLDEMGVPHLTDFGLAKRLDDVHGLSRSGMVLGTASYMSSEQASGRGDLIGVTSDVYSLGATLYHALSGRPPFVGGSHDETLRKVLFEEPISPREQNPAIPSDLDTICMMCLPKNAEERFYSSAAAMAGDLRRFLRGEAIDARPASLLGRFWRWCRREPRMAAAVAALILALAVGFCTTAWQTRRARSAEARASHSLLESQYASYANQIALAQRQWRENSVDDVGSLLEKCAPEMRNWEWHYLNKLRNSELLVVPNTTCFVLQENGSMVASGATDGTVRLWDSESWTERFSQKVHTGRVRKLFHLSSTGDLVSLGDDYEWRPSDPGGFSKATCELKIVHLTHDTQKLLGQIETTAEGGGFETQVSVASLSSGDTVLAANLSLFETTGRQYPGPYRVEVWNLAERRILCSIAGEEIEQIQLSPDGKLLAIQESGTLRVHETKTGELLYTLGPPAGNYAKGDRHSVYSFSPDGGVFAASNLRGEVEVVRAQTGSRLHLFSTAEVEWGNTEIDKLSFDLEAQLLVARFKKSTRRPPRAWSLESGAELSPTPEAILIVEPFANDEHVRL
ncbi:MAG: protein kinase, partial [Planctomycetales bacterium]|nr:protein kinase [Planctomycetales bacterium]